MVKELLLRFLESFWSGAVVGSVITLLWSAFRAKSAKFRYSTRVERVAVAAEDPVFGDVRVQWKGTAARNLYMATMEVENASAKDFEDVNLTIYAEENTKFLSESTQIVGTPDIVRWSPEFQQQLNVSSGETPTQQQWYLYNARREYVVPVFNRRQLLRFQYLCTRDDNQLLPNVFINAPVRGVKLVQQHHVNFVLQVPAALAVIPGVMTALLISVASVALLENIWLAAIVSLFAGLTALVAGAVVYRVCRRLWNLLFG